MDAVKFLKERNRMCKGISCNECPIREKTLDMDISCDLFGADVEEIAEIVEAVESWSKEKPEELGKKYIIEINRTNCDGSAFGMKGLNCWLDRYDLAHLKEYKGE